MIQRSSDDVGSFSGECGKKRPFGVVSGPNRCTPAVSSRCSAGIYRSIRRAGNLWTAVFLATGRGPFLAPQGTGGATRSPPPIETRRCGMDAFGGTRRCVLIALMAVLVMLVGATGAYAGGRDYGSAPGYQKGSS